VSADKSAGVSNRVAGVVAPTSISVSDAGRLIRHRIPPVACPAFCHAACIGLSLQYRWPSKPPSRRRLPLTMRLFSRQRPTGTPVLHPRDHEAFERGLRWDAPPTTHASASVCRSALPRLRLFDSCWRRAATLLPALRGTRVDSITILREGALNAWVSW
jgi:hypothetical protein